MCPGEKCGAIKKNTHNLHFIAITSLSYEHFQRYFLEIMYPRLILTQTDKINIKSEGSKDMRLVSNETGVSSIK